MVANPFWGGKPSLRREVSRSASNSGTLIPMTRPIVLLLVILCANIHAQSAQPVPLPKIRVSADGHGFVTAKGDPFVPFGVTYYRPGTKAQSTPIRIRVSPIRRNLRMPPAVRR